MSRRALLAGAASGAAIAGLSGCGGGEGVQPVDKPAVSPPTRVPYTEVQPDMPAAKNGIPEGFLAYPADPVSTGRAPLHVDKPISALLQGAQAPNPRGRNPWWQQFESDIGTSISFDTVQSTDYTQKFQVTVAGGDIPDLCQVVPIPYLPQVLDKYFADLSDYLSGDAVQEYPGLASIPTDTWSIPTIGGRIYGVAQSRPKAGIIMSARGDLLEKYGIDPGAIELSDGQEFLSLCKELSDPAKSIYAMGARPADWMLRCMIEMMEGGNTWNEENGRFTSWLEAEQMPDALNEVGKMVKNRYFHPDSSTSPGQNLTWWTGGITSLFIQNYPGWGDQATLHPDWKATVVRLPRWNGGGPAPKLFGAPGYDSWTGIKKADEGRVREVLSVLDLIASPFGTREYLRVNYGVTDTDYTLDGTDPSPTEAAAGDALGALLYAGSQKYASIYVPLQPDVARAQHAYLSDVLPTGVPDASQGLFSDSRVSSGAAADKTVGDAQNEMIIGRRSISEWPDVLAQWRKTTGDAQRAEYEKAFEAAHG